MLTVWAPKRCWHVPLSGARARTVVWPTTCLSAGRLRSRVWEGGCRCLTGPIWRFLSTVSEGALSALCGGMQPSHWLRHRSQPILKADRVKADAPDSFKGIDVAACYCASHKNWIRNIRFSISNRPLSQ